MTETPGAVIKVERDHAFVEIGPRSVGCGRCHEAGGCGSQRPGGAAAGPKRILRLPNDLNVAVGDSVLVVIPDGALLRAALLAYGLPLLLLLAGAAIGAAWSDGVAAAGAAGGLAIAAVAPRLTRKRLRVAREPLVTMRIKPCAFNSSKENHTC